MNKLSGKQYFNITIFALVGQIAWTMENMFYNLYIKDEFSASPAMIALMVALSAVVATLTTLIMGALSDKLGKRKIFIVTGYIIWSIVILAFTFVNKNTIKDAALGIGLIIALDCIMTFFGSTANDAAFNAYLTEISSDENRGKVEGINSAMPLVSILIVFGGLSGFAKIQEDGTDTWWIVFVIISALVLLCGIIGIFTIQEPKIERKQDSYFKNIIYGFRPSVIKQNKILYLVLIGFALFGISLQVYMPYYIIYLQGANIELSLASSLGMDAYVLVMAPAIIVASIATIFYGRLFDKIGFMKSLIPALCVYFAGLCFLSFGTSVALLFIGCLLMMTGYLCAMAIFNAMIRKYTPEGNVGQFQGVRMVCSVLIPMLTGPFIGSAICGGGASFGVTTDNFVVSKFIFLGGLIVGLFIVLPLLFVKDKKHAQE